MLEGMERLWSIQGLPEPLSGADLPFIFLSMLLCALQVTPTQLALAMWAARPTAMPQFVKFTGSAGCATLSWTLRMQPLPGVL